jgi:predicted dehydrogenase
MSLRIGIYGTNGHQIHYQLVSHPLARLTATADFPVEKLPLGLQADRSISHYQSLDELLADPNVDMVSLCSPRRCDQAADAIKALRAGKHVYAEKPCALNETDLDAILKTARETGRMFHEMAGTAFDQPYFAMRQAVQEGRIGQVVQIIAEKSYPYHADRPQDEEIDGGLICQCAIHAIRLVEQVGGVRIASVHALETTAGNPEIGGGLRMAACLMLSLQNGGLASVTANYLNPRGTGVWGRESLRILGTLGMIESVDGGARTRLVIGEKDFGPFATEQPGVDYLDAYVKTILGQGTMPLPLEEELSPTRWVLRAKAATGPQS